MTGRLEVVGLEAVRARPGLYVGDCDAYGLHHLVYEVLDNAVNEALAGCCTAIEVVIHSDNSITVRDNGRGIPVGPHPAAQGMDALEVVMTKLHTSSTLPAQKVAGGIHGVGLCCVNALSDWLHVEVQRDGKVYKQSYSAGVPCGPVTEEGVTDKHGTQISFRPDAGIFTVTTYDFETLATRLQVLAFLNDGLHTQLHDERTGKRSDFSFENGLKSHLELINRSSHQLHDEPICFATHAADLSIAIALQWIDDPRDAHVVSYVNTVETRDGGSHLAGLTSAITKLLGRESLKGLTAIVSVTLQYPAFGLSMKSRLDNPEVKDAVERLVVDRLGAWFTQHPVVAERVARRSKTAP